MTLPAALGASPGLAAGVLAPGLAAGLGHASARVRGASLAFHDAPGVQATLGRHLRGVRPARAPACA